MSDRELRIGIGKLPGLSTSGPWYVTIYNRALTEDRAQGWFETLQEATGFAHKLLASCRDRREAKR